MELKNYFAQDDKGNILAGATCYLYLPGTSTPASDLQDAAGAALSNPFNAGDNGLVQFAAPNGRYDLRVVKGARDYRVRVQCNDVAGNVLVNELAAPGGADMTGYDDRYAPAYLKTVSDLLTAERVSVMRFIPREKHAALYDGTSSDDFTSNLTQALAAFTAGGCLTLPPVTFNTSGLVVYPSSNLKIEGSGWKSKIKNNSASGAHGLYFPSASLDERDYGIDISCLTLEGNSLSGRGIQIDRGGWYDKDGREASVTSLDRLNIQGHGSDGVMIGKSATEGAGNAVKLIRSLIRNNGRTGVVCIGQTNIVSIFGNVITLNAQDGVEMNQVASSNTIDQNFIADNTRFGVHAFRCEQPMVVHNGFNRNRQGAVVFSGNATGSVKYTESGLIMGNLFGDNGTAAATRREVQVNNSKGTNIVDNYFYGTGQDSMIYLGDYAEGVMIAGNRFKLTTEVPLEIKAGAVNCWYTFDDDIADSALRQIITNKIQQYIIGANTTLFQTRVAAGDPAPRFRLRGDGRMEWSSGSAAFDIAISRINAGSIRVEGGMEMTRMELATGLSAPTAKTGYLRLYEDGGQLKFILPNGVVRTVTVT
ncbi:Right handed beta helix region [compost metagenome]